MMIKGYNWRAMTAEQRMRLLMIAADQNWMGRSVKGDKRK
jgi:hypothetical protein